MTYRFGIRSRANLETCHLHLQDICEASIKVTPVDFAIICGHRGEEAQMAAFTSGLSKVAWPDSEHNHTELGEPNSRAIDFVPYRAGHPVDWQDTHAFAVVAGVLMAKAIELGHPLIWGGDWDSDGSTRDQSFMDWGHVELA